MKILAVKIIFVTTIVFRYFFAKIIYKQSLMRRIILIIVEKYDKKNIKAAIEIWNTTFLLAQKKSNKRKRGRHLRARD